MIALFDLPLRQKILLSLTILTGAFLVLVHNTTIISQESLNIAIFLYGFLVPALLLGQETVIDLNKPHIFKIWVIVGLVFLTLYFFMNGSPDFIIERSKNCPSNGLNKFIGDSSTSPLKALPMFLTIYFLFNTLMKRATGNYIINTFKITNWYNEAAGREIYWYDILATYTLLSIIICSALFDF